MLSSHMKYFKEQEMMVTNQGQKVRVYKLEIDEDEHVLKEWANHLRKHYCSDDELEFLAPSTGRSNQEYLSQIKFPDPTIGIGAATMSGDFAEILVHDYIEFIEDYYTTRTRYDRKVNRNSSTMGSDVLGYKCQDINNPSKDDELEVLEVKAQSSETKPTNKLQLAVEHSVKDELRLAESLNAEAQRLYHNQRLDEVRKVQRFQNKTDRPYKLLFSAVAVHSSKSFDENLIRLVDISNHPDQNLNLLVIYSDHLMAFIKGMYERASKC